MRLKGNSCIHYSASWRSFAEYWKYFVARFNDVHAFGYNFAGSERIWMKFGELQVYCLELALTDFGRDPRRWSRSATEDRATPLTWVCVCVRAPFWKFRKVLKYHRIRISKFWSIIFCVCVSILCIVWPQVRELAAFGTGGAIESGRKNHPACLCVSERHFYHSTLTDFNETWSQGIKDPTLI